MSSQVIPIKEWEAMSPDARSEYLRTNRLFLFRYDVDDKLKVKTHVVLERYADSVIVK